ncbi:hypothetical protein BDV12DRAFT_194944 [Aspergillus spectabilis]
MPSTIEHSRRMIRKDVIASTAIVQYDLGYRLEKGYARKDTLEANLGRPNQQIRSFISKITTGDDDLRRRQCEYLAVIQGAVDAECPGDQEDTLFKKDYKHRERGCQCAVSPPTDKTVVARQRKPGILPFIHFGRLASGDTVMMTAKARDATAKKEQVIGFEMEGAGVWDNLPCILVKGVSDYADSHKSKDWQFFAAASAAACMRALLDERPISISQQTVGPEQENSIPLRENPEKQPAELSDAASKKREENYLQLLTFPRADFRRNKILDAHEKTCEWVVKRPEYQSWVNADSEGVRGKFFWIKGKPGAGKSTLMKYLLDNAYSDRENDIILSFFFYAQGEKLERSIVGMYRSLLHQLLSSSAVLPEKKQLFFHFAAAEMQDQDGCLKWKKNDLESLLLSIIPSLLNCRIVILIDALDEGKEKEIREMITFLQKQLTSSANACGVHLRVCLASRHYPSLTVDQAIELVLEDQPEHGSDIREYVEASFKGGRSKTAEEIRTEICERASGVFLWVHLVVRSLNETFETGNLQKVHKQLYEIPDDLDTLFINILTRDKKSLNDMLTCLELVLFSPRPLSSEEAYFAIMFASCGEVRRDIELHTKSILENYIVNVSKGIVEVSGSKPRSVHFIHESVRDSFSDEMDLTDCGSRQIPTIGAAGVPQADFLRQFSASLSQFKKVYNAVECPKISRYQCDVTLLYILADKSLAHLVSLEVSVNGYGWDRSGRYKSPMGTAIYSSDTATIKALLGCRIDQGRAEDASLLSTEVVAHMKDHLIEYHKKPRRLDKIPYGEFLVNTTIERNNPSLLIFLLQTGQVDLPAAVEASYLRRDQLDLLKIVLDFWRSNLNIAGKDYPRVFGPPWGSRSIDVINILLDYNCLDFHTTLKRLIKSGCDPTHRDSGGQDPLCCAAKKGRTNLVHILLEVESVDIDAKDNHGRTPLSLAAAGYCGSANLSTVTTLLKTGMVNANSKDEFGRTPLFWAILSQNAAIVRTILKVPHVKVGYTLASGHSLLSIAAVYGTGEIIEMLLATGRFDINAQDSNGRTPLSWATGPCFPRKGCEWHYYWRPDHLDRVKALLSCAQLDPNIPDSLGFSPLRWARIYSRLMFINGRRRSLEETAFTPSPEKIIKLLVRRGALRKMVLKESLDPWKYRSCYVSNLKNIFALSEHVMIHGWDDGMGKWHRLERDVLVDSGEVKPRIRSPGEVEYSSN